MTLVELMGGLTVAGLVLAVALRMFVVLSASVARVDDATLRTEQYRNGITWLAQRLREAAEPNDSQPFAGLRSSIAFRAQGTNGGIGNARDLIEISVDTLRRWVARHQSIQLVLSTNVDSANIDYLVSRGLDAIWHSSWISTQTRPVGLRIRLATTRSQAVTVDTLLFTVGLRL